VDAHRLGDGRWGLGWILRREDGGTVVVATKVVRSGEDVKTAEALGILEVLQYIQNQGLKEVAVETYSQECANVIFSKSCARSYWGRTIRACISLCECLDKVEIKWTNRMSNHVAHEIARWAAIEPDRFWTSMFPRPIFSHIQKDMIL
jgi:ribonuclease HI